jgi:hypothetical protein
MDKVALEISESFCAEKESRNKEKCRHAECAQMPHSEMCIREVLLDVKKANEQKNESLEFVNPADSCFQIMDCFAFGSQ